MKKRFTEGQIIRVLQEYEQAENIPELCRRHNLTEQSSPTAGEISMVVWIFPRLSA